MRNLRFQKTEKNGEKFWQKIKPKIQEKNTSEKHLKNEWKSEPKIRWNSRTMEWLNLPPKVQKEFKDNLIAMNLDFMQYTCYNIQDAIINLRNIVWFTWEIDNDNSNIEFNYTMNLSMTNTQTKNGHAYSIFFNSPWFASVMIASVEVYSEDKVQLLKTEGKIVFYGAYFVFQENIQEEAPEIIRFYNAIETWTILKYHNIKKDNKIIQKPLYKRTRVDIATDVWIEMSKKWLTSYIQPHKNSKHVPRPYNYDPVTEIFQSVGYIPRLKQGIWIRVYNKVLDMQSKNKKSWHPNYGTAENPIVTRLEIVYSWDFAQNKIQDLFEYTKFRLLWDEKTKLKPKIRPKSEYSPLSAYEYFKRYAKNHGKTLREVLDDVMCITITEEEGKDKFPPIKIETN